MENFKNLAIVFLGILALTFTGCDGEDDEDAVGTGDLIVTISGLDGLDGAVTVSGPNGYLEELTATTTLEDVAVGEYTVSAASVNENGRLLAVNPDDSEQEFTLTADQSLQVSVDYLPAATVIGIVGKWYSAGDDVAPLLVNLFGTDSIYAEFRADQTYTVEQYDASGSKLTFTGVYTQQASTEGDIYTIVAEQSSPSALTSEGIFEITSGVPDVMQYEVVQTEPAIGATPPTPAAGFGSTNGGAFGDANVQVYRRLVE